MQTETFYHVEQDSPEWKNMWEQLAKQDINKKYPDPFTCKNHYEIWQYMGSSDRDGSIKHTFRHRCHPSTNMRLYFSLDASAEFIASAKPVIIY